MGKVLVDLFHALRAVFRGDGRKGRGRFSRAERFDPEQSYAFLVVVIQASADTAAAPITHQPDARRSFSAACRRAVNRQPVPGLALLVPADHG
ncbi:hypothetical protein [Burkholderia stabilis]|uniref:hypothetical protein n=1 Tax=Burkholderia stabilis TaxID=95485 RepID=UPI001F4ADDCD|nr:hypothetical protein [Burkholderia stabilis]